MVTDGWPHPTVVDLRIGGERLRETERRCIGSRPPGVPGINRRKSALAPAGLTRALPRGRQWTGGDLLRGLAETLTGNAAFVLAAAIDALREASAAEAAIVAAAEARAAVVRGSAWAAARKRRRPWAFQHGSTSRIEACKVMASSKNADRARPPADLRAWTRQQS